jgi:phasin family protein
MLTNEQITSVQKSNLQALLSLGNKAFESLESLVALNLQVTKTALDDAAEASLSTLSAKDPQSLQPSTEKATAYGRRVYEIATSMKTEIAKVVGDSAAGAQGSFIGLFDAAAKNAPLGSDNGVALWKSAVATANNAFESLQKAAKQASDIAEANYTAVTAQAVKSTQGSGKAKRG